MFWIQTDTNRMQISSLGMRHACVAWENLLPIRKQRKGLLSKVWVWLSKLTFYCVLEEQPQNNPSSNLRFWSAEGNWLEIKSFFVSEAERTMSWWIGLKIMPTLKWPKWTLSWFLITIIIHFCHFLFLQRQRRHDGEPRRDEKKWNGNVKWTDVGDSTAYLLTTRG